MEEILDITPQQKETENRRYFLYLVLLPVYQIIAACTKPKIEPLVTLPTSPTNKDSDIFDALKNKSLLAGDFINLEWRKTKETSSNLEFSNNGGNNWQLIPTLPEQNIHAWDIPQVSTKEAMLRVVDNAGKQLAVSAAFSINPTFVVMLESHATLAKAGAYKIFTEPRLGDFVLKRDSEAFIAFNLICTHLGCTVRDNSGFLKCPCHGSEYDINGAVTRGPADANLKSYNTKWIEEKGRVLVYV
jgi:nitrite reductase/ring-hydroxylating ferredoxin subunit